LKYPESLVHFTIDGHQVAWYNSIKRWGADTIATSLHKGDSMDKLKKALSEYQIETYTEGGYTDWLLIISDMLAEYDEDEEMTRGIAEQIFSDILDNMYRPQ